MCALAPDADAPSCAIFPSALGSGWSAGLGRAAPARGQTVTVAPHRPEKTAGAPARGAPHGPGLGGRARRPLLAAAHGRAPERVVPRRRPPAVPPQGRGARAPGRAGPGLGGGPRMRHRPPPGRIVLATPPVAFRHGRAGLAAVGRQGLGEHPRAGAVSGCRHRAGTALQRWRDDGQGSWLGMPRLAPGRCRWWPPTADARVPLSARARMLGRWHGAPERAQMARAARRPAPHTPRAGLLAAPPETLLHGPRPRGRWRAGGGARWPGRHAACGGHPASCAAAACPAAQPARHDACRAGPRAPSNRA